MMKKNKNKIEKLKKKKKRRQKGVWKFENWRVNASCD